MEIDMGAYSVSLPSDLPAGLHIAYAWVHEAGDLGRLVEIDGQRLTDYCVSSAAMNALTRREEPDMPEVTADQIRAVAAWLCSQTEPVTEDDGYGDTWEDAGRDYWNATRGCR